MFWNLIISVAFFGKFAIFSDFGKIQDFFRKPFFLKKKLQWAFCRISKSFRTGVLGFNSIKP